MPLASALLGLLGLPGLGADGTAALGLRGLLQQGAAGDRVRVALDDPLPLLLLAANDIRLQLFLHVRAHTVSCLHE